MGRTFASSLLSAGVLLAGCAEFEPVERRPDAGRFDRDAGNAGALVDSGGDDGGGEVVHAEPPPPPVSGGTMIVTSDGLAVAADPDRDRVWVVDPAEESVLGWVVLEPGDEPGRLVEDGAGDVHVALRSGRALVTIDVGARETLRRRELPCSAPRGVAWDASDDSVHVACADGVLVTLPAAGGEPTRVLPLEPDLRDVLVAGDRLLVSTFRSAELLVVDRASGTVEERLAPPVITGTDRAVGDLELEPRVAWRIRPRAAGGVWMLHQSHVSSTVEVDEGAGYGGGPCRTGTAASTVTALVPGEAPESGAVLPMTVLAVDLAVNVAHEEVTTVSASTLPELPEASEPQRWSTSELMSSTLERCAAPDFRALGPEAQQTSVAYLDGTPLYFQREPAAVVSPDVTIPLPAAESRRDTGHDFFHKATPAFIACASCHPEGREDGHTWDLSGRHRRTQSLVGGLLGTEPFHWRGDQPDFATIMEDTLTERMGSETPTDAQTEAVATWIDTLPVVSGASDPDVAERGLAVFEGEAGCTDCHAGPRRTDNRTVDVGTGGAFQVPALLGVSLRAPYFHDGCAATLAEVLDGCGEDGPHGDAGALGADQRADLLAYLRSL